MTEQAGTKTKTSDPATEAFLSALEEKRKQDPLIGAKLGGKDLFQRLVRVMKGERGVHIESLLSALGALAGYSCQASLRAQAIAKNLPETALLTTAGATDGKQYFFGDLLNQALAESQHSVWSLAAGAAQHNGCKSLPDINGIFAHVAGTIGTSSFGIPRIPEGHITSDRPIDYLKALWPPLLPVVNLYCKLPAEWPFMLGVAVQEALDAGKEAISQEIALLIVMESAVPMSKVDLVTA